MKKISLLIVLHLLLNTIYAQVSINSDNTAPDPSAMLEVKSTQRGFLPPRMTALEISYIPSPANGLVVYNSTDDHLYIYSTSSNSWKRVAYDAQNIIPFICGSVITVNHFAGDVAPVTKTVSYATTLTTLTGVEKCWIIQNLGADHQATSVDDATESPAGWYWQFNRKQGFKHDGSSRTPNLVWDATNDNSSSTWEPSKDPCTIELGPGWRIPTHSEWDNVDVNGGWTNWIGPFSSVLKLHAAGGLDSGQGALHYRGSTGIYRSSTQYDASYGWNLYFNNDFSNMNEDSYKAVGASLRCIRD